MKMLDIFQDIQLKYLEILKDNIPEVLIDTQHIGNDSILRFECGTKKLWVQWKEPNEDNYLLLDGQYKNAVGFGDGMHYHLTDTYKVHISNPNLLTIIDYFVIGYVLPQHDNYEIVKKWTNTSHSPKSTETHFWTT